LAAFSWSVTGMTLLLLSKMESRKLEVASDGTHVRIVLRRQDAKNAAARGG
jgi:hypothetical protein